jgi:hypothetical protein
VKLCSARALQVYMLGIGVAIIGVSFAAYTTAITLLLVIMLPLWALMTIRVISAARSGRCWRRHTAR